MKFYRDPDKTSNHPGGHCYWEEATPKAYTLVPIPMLENFDQVKAGKLLDQAKSVPHYHNEAMNWHLWIWQQLWTWHGGGLFIADADPWRTRVCPWQPGTSASWRLCAFPAEQVWGLKSRESGVRLADNMISVLQRQQEEPMGEFIRLSSGTSVDMSVNSWNAWINVAQQSFHNFAYAVVCGMRKGLLQCFFKYVDVAWPTFNESFEFNWDGFENDAL